MLRTVHTNVTIGDFLRGCGTRVERVNGQRHAVPPEKNAESSSRVSSETTKPTCGSLFAGQYELGELLGADAHGDLYRAIDRENQGVVDLRVVSKNIFADQRAIEEYLRCGRQYVNLRRQPFLKIFEAGESDGYCFIVMELLDGTTLADTLGSRLEYGWRFSLNRAVSHARSLCDACAHARIAGIDLRINPAHIVTSPRGIRLSDPAILRPRLRVYPDDQDKCILDKRIAPAQRPVGQTLDVQSEMHHIGRVFYSFLADQAPAVPAAPLSSLRQDVPEPLAHLIAQLLSADPAQRPQSIEIVISALDAIASAIQLTPAVPEAEIDQIPVSLQFAIRSPRLPEFSARVDSMRSFKRLAAIFAGLLALLVAVSGAVLLARSFAAFGVHRTATVPHRWLVSDPRGFSATTDSAEGSLASTSHDTFASIGTERESAFVATTRDAAPTQPDDRLVEQSNQPAASSAVLAKLVGFAREDTGKMSLVSAPWHFDGPRRDSLPVPLNEEEHNPAGDGSSQSEPMVIPGGTRDAFGTQVPLISWDDVRIVEFVPSLQDWTPPAPVEDPPVVPEASSHAAPAAPVIIPDIRVGPVEFRQVRIKEDMGVELRFPFRANRYRGNQIEIGAYISSADGTPLKDLDRQFESKRGNVYTKKTISIDSDRYSNDGFTLFLPYGQFDGLPGGTHRLQAQVFVWAGPPFERRMVTGKPQQFDLTLYKFLAKPRIASPPLAPRPASPQRWSPPPRPTSTSHQRSTFR